MTGEMQEKRSVRRRRLRRRRSYTRIYILAGLLLACLVFYGWFYLRPQTPSPEPTTPSSQKILVLGIDPREDDPGRSDTMLLATILTETKQASLLSIPRDTRVDMEGRGFDKINHAYAYGGPEYTQKTLEALLATKIDHYIMVDIQAFQRMIDALGGVNMEIEKRMYYEDPWDDNGGLVIDLYPGLQHLDGEQATGYVRYRDNEGDIGRIGRQQKFLKALLTQAVSPEILPHLPQILKEMQSLLKTDLSLSDMLHLTAMLPDIREHGVNTAMLPGQPAWWNDTSYWLPDIKSARATLAGQAGSAMTSAMNQEADAIASNYKASLPDDLIDTEGTLIAATDLEKAKSLVPANITVTVLNSSGISGAGAEVAEILRQKGFKIASVGNGNTNSREQTTISVPERSVNAFYGMPFPCIITTNEEKDQATVNIGLDYDQQE